MADFDLNDLAVFVPVIDRGGFAAAARELGVPTSTVSRTIARLEARTGTRLLHRTPRSLHPTSEGREIYASVAGALGTLERAARSLEPATRKPKGLLRVTAPNDTGSSFLAEIPSAPADLHLPARVTAFRDFVAEAFAARVAKGKKDLTT